MDLWLADAMFSVECVGGAVRTAAWFVSSDQMDDFAAFYRLHEDAVLGYFLRRTRSAELAADLTAETFARALEGRRRLGMEPITLDDDALARVDELNTVDVELFYDEDRVKVTDVAALGYDDAELTIEEFLRWSRLFGQGPPQVSGARDGADCATGHGDCDLGQASPSQ